jgi:thioredoxin-like negative regulator of GroEL
MTSFRSVLHCPQAPVAVLSPENFDEVLDSSESRAWLLKFYAPWCSHCKKLAPVIEEAALKNHGLRFAKIDATKHTEIAGRYHVKGFPALYWLRDRRLHPYNGV